MKNTFSVLFYRGELKKSGRTNVMIRITVCGVSIPGFSSKLEIDPAQWDQPAQLGNPRSHSPEIKTLNLALTKIRTTITTKYQDGIIRGINYTPQELKEAVCPEQKEDKETIIYFFDKHNELYKKKVAADKKTEETYKRYLRTKDRFIEFLKETYKVKDISIHKLTSVMIEEYEVYLRTHTEWKSGHNNTMKYIQRLRTVILFAQKCRCNFVDPFLLYDITWEKIERTFLDIPEIITMVNAHFEIERLEQVKDVYNFAMFTGLSHKDMKLFSEEALRTLFQKDWIKAIRAKTGTNISLPLLEIPRMILDKYAGKLPNGKLLPVISNQKMNAYLKEIADICGIKKNLTCHIARHTFATLALTLGVSIETVSKMLGHTNITTTQIYAKIIDMKINFDMEKFALQLSKIEGLPRTEPAKKLAQEWQNGLQNVG